MSKYEVINFGINASQVCCTRLARAAGGHLFTSNDGLGAAFVEVPNVEEFMNKLIAAQKIGVEHSDNANEYMRLFGYVYELEQFRQFWADYSTKTVDEDPETFEGEKLRDVYHPHNGQTVLYAEYKKYLFVENNKIVMKGEAYTDGWAFDVGQDLAEKRIGFVSNVHSHPNSSPFYINYMKWDQRLARPDIGPSSVDYHNANHKTTGDVRFRVVTDKDNIYFYKASGGSRINVSIPR